MERWFIDTSFLIAISARVDQHKLRADELLKRLEQAGFVVLL